MEDTSNTSNKEPKHSLKVYFETDSDIDRDLTEKLEQSNILLSTDENSQNSIKINQQHANFSIKYKESVYFVTKPNLVPTIKLIKKTHELSLKKEEYKVATVKVGLNRLSRQHKKISFQSQYLELLNKSLEDNYNIFSFIKDLFSLKPLKKFQTIHMFIHEKGQANATHYEISRENSREYFHAVSDFNSLFQSIKKSKNRSYGQTSLKGVNLEILGTFLAHEFSLKSYNVILIVSRNDFLPQSSEEVTFFNFLATNISSYIEIFLEKKLILNKKQIIENAINDSPYEISYSNEQDANFNSLAYDQYTLNNGQVLKIAPLFKDIVNQADIFHHERVSLLGELLNTLRHELSNPIFGLQLSTELLLMDNHSEDNKEMLKEVLKSIKRSQSIIENFTKLYKGSEEHENVDVIALINEVFTLTKSESRHVQKTVNSTSEEIILHTNSTWLAQIFFNLIINSAQASRGRFEKGARFNIDISINNGSILFNIQDNGPGIPKEKTNEIFKAFYTTKEKGTGLGLSIASSLTQKLKGTIKCIPNDKGANFLLQLPYENTSH